MANLQKRADHETHFMRLNVSSSAVRKHEDEAKILLKSDMDA